MKKLLFIISIVLFSLPAFARHIAGGELMYQYLGDAGGGNSNYLLTLRLFRDCFSTGPLLEREQVNVGVYDENNNLIKTVPLSISGAISTLILNTGAFPCLVGNVNVCYQVALYTNTVTLPDNTGGYTLSRTGCCRIDNISGLSQPSSVGSNYVTHIPGRNTLPIGHNSSPTFNVKDTALVCANRKFSLDFGATDADNDSLSYAFCNAYTSRSGSNNQPPAAVLSLIPIPYAYPYSGAQPLGPGVSIDAKTGMIQGVAPPEGQYVVNVCVTEWRNGNAISEHRKDFILKVQNCDIAEAVLPSRIVRCDTNLVKFENLSVSSAITSYRWDFGDPRSPAIDSTPTPSHVYTDTGTYMVRLFIKGPKGCTGSDSTKVMVYPGFKSAFTVKGSCYFKPYQFTDASFARYGVINSWFWYFNDAATDGKDTSYRQNPSYTYKQPDTSNIRLIVTSSKGCIDTSLQTLIVRDKPFIAIPFHDTLICSIDTLPINVKGNGSFSWLPNKNILHSNTANPLVFPQDTTRYIVSLNDGGCINTDTVTVNVLSYITVQLRPDTVVCTTDTFHLHPISHALSYQWTPVASLNNPLVKYPLASPASNTTYAVIANLGKCEASAQIFVKVSPYPIARMAIPDTTICYGSRVSLKASYTGTNYQWSPTASLINTRTLTPVAGPGKSTRYFFTVTDTTAGACPKAVRDSVNVTVIPMIMVDAGKDTSVVADQPLQLNAVAPMANRFLWVPATGLNQVNIANPVAQLGIDIDSIRYRVLAYGAGGCYGEDDIVVRIFKTQPEIFVPSAFTPNGDGKNDLLKPMIVGISTLRYFRVLNRWGQIVFSTSEPGKGWDGSFNGVKQPSGTYIYITEGMDYMGKTVSRKGTVVLIR